jgi:hypothetical protein
MTAHVIIPGASPRGDGTSEPGCAVCGLPEALVDNFPACPGASGRWTIAPSDQRTIARRRKRKHRERSGR